MGRPVKIRTPETYRRDLDRLGALRTAIISDLKLSEERIKTTVRKIDDLELSLRELLREIETVAA